MRCKICGSELSIAEENAGFCDRCGTKIEIDEDVGEVKANYYNVDINPADGDKRKKQAKRKFTPAHLIVLSCLVLAFAAVGIFYAVNQNPKDDMTKIKTLVAPSLDVNFITNFSEGLAVVAKGSYDSHKYGYIDVMTGKEVIACEYDYAMPFREGLACVSKNSGWGYIDKTGKEVIACEYDYAMPFYNGLARVTKDTKNGYINTSGEVIIPFEYDDGGDFMFDLTAVCKNGKWGLIDRYGYIVLPIEYNWIGYFSDYFSYSGFFAVQTRGGQCGLVDKTGRFVLDCIYDELQFNTFNGLIYVKQNGKWGIFQIEDYTPDPNINPYYYRFPR